MSKLTANITVAGLDELKAKLARAVAAAEELSAALDDIRSHELDVSAAIVSKKEEA